MSNAKSIRTSWLKTRHGILTVGLASLLVAYILASRAIDTGSWQQYGLTVLLVGIAINQIVHFFRNKG